VDASPETDLCLCVLPRSPRDRNRARGPDHFGPFFGVFGDELAKLGGRHRHWHAAEIDKASLEFGIGESRVNFFVQLVEASSVPPRSGAVALGEHLPSLPQGQ
jgi:hypothetical protein